MLYFTIVGDFSKSGVEADKIFRFKVISTLHICTNDNPKYQGRTQKKYPCMPSEAVGMVCTTFNYVCVSLISIDHGIIDQNPVSNS